MMLRSVAEDLLTTREAAALLGVGTTSIKRWADQGLLRCVKTPGGHRRIARDSIAAFLRTTELAPATADGQLDDWLSLLIASTDATEVHDALVVHRASCASWTEASDKLAPVIVEIGRRWETGVIDVLAEHLASERLARGLARCAEELPVADDARSCLLITAPGEDHTLGLSLLEPCLREAGWNARWSGRRTPSDHVEKFLETGAVDMIAVSASEYSTDGPALARFADRLAALCERRGIALVVGGRGAWPASLRHGSRLHSFAELAPLL